ncbi:D-arabinono-1,4-lactone oxidase [Stomatohabitans albus]|uniref:D-arabinono-1,4-lactone oxidase n=1 Tax=Stomatohabitans albus TaxID=3110766 RepID=UPI00300DBD07
MVVSLPKPAGVAVVDHPWRSSSGAVTAHPHVLAYPRSIEALSEIICEVAERGGTIRPVGEGQSCNPIMATNDTMVSLAQLNIPMVEVNDTGPRPLVTMNAGAAIGAIEVALSSYGCALPQVFSPNATATLGGLIATAGRGEAAIAPPLHAHILAMEIVDGIGHRRWLTHEDALFATRCSLGTLGVITRVAMRVQPDTNYGITRVRVPMEAVFADFEAHTQDHDVVWFDWLPHSNQALLTMMDKTDEPVTPGGKAAIRRLARRGMHTLAANFRLPRHLAATGMASLWSTNEEVQAAAHAIPPKDVRGVHHMGAVLPAATWKDAIYALYDVMVSMNVPAPLPVQITAVAHDTSAWLSPASNGPGVQLTLAAIPGTRPGPWFGAAMDVLLHHGGRPNWDGVHRLSLEQMHELYPEITSFNAVRTEFDPAGVFSGVQVATLLGRIR